MVKEMEMEKNILMIDQNLKDNFYVIRNIMEKDMMKIKIQYMK